MLADAVDARRLNYSRGGSTVPAVVRTPRRPDGAGEAPDATESRRTASQTRRRSAGSSRLFLGGCGFRSVSGSPLGAACRCMPLRQVKLLIPAGSNEGFLSAACGGLVHPLGAYSGDVSGVVMMFNATDVT